MREESCQSIFGKIEMVQTPCTLIQYFLKEGKQYDKDCTLTSFERKRRYDSHLLVNLRTTFEILCLLETTSHLDWTIMLTNICSVLNKLVRLNFSSNLLLILKLLSGSVFTDIYIDTHTLDITGDKHIKSRDESSRTEPTRSARINTSCKPAHFGLMFIRHIHVHIRYISIS